MAPIPPTPEEQAKRDAWVNTIRSLARKHKCTHRSDIGHAIKFARTELPNPNMQLIIPTSIRFCMEAGIPQEELVALYTLIYG